MYTLVFVCSVNLGEQNRENMDFYKKKCMIESAVLDNFLTLLFLGINIVSILLLVL